MKKNNKITILLLTLLTACVVLLSACSGEEVSIPDGFIYRNYSQVGVVAFEPQEGVPVSQYTADDFIKGDDGRISYIGDDYTAHFGIDVSIYQKAIDWEKVKADGVEFAFIRIGYRGYTEGGLNTDKNFYENIQNAQKAGIKVGVYFYSQAISWAEAREEAVYVKSLLGDITLDLPVIFDWEVSEYEDSRTTVQTLKNLSVYIDAFCLELENSGYKTGVYFNRFNGYSFVDFTALDDRMIWVASLGDWPDFYYEHEIWQYTFTGKVDGIEGDVDLDMWLEPVKTAG